MSGMIGSSPRDSAINSMNQRSDLLSSLVNASGGRRIRRKNKKGGATIVAQPPGMNLLNDPSKGTSQSVSSQVTANAAQINQAGANSVFDNVALVPIPPPPPRGGSRRSKRTRNSRTKKSRTKKSRTKKSRTKKSRTKKSRK